MNARLGATSPIAVVSITTPVDTRRRAERVKQDFFSASRAVRELLASCGLGVAQASVHDQCFQAACNWASYWETRTHQMERAFREVLAQDGLTDEHRARVEAVMKGKAPRTRDGRALSDDEWRLVRWYRAADAMGRQVLRTICGRMPAEAEGHTDQTGGRPLGGVAR